MAYVSLFISRCSLLFTFSCCRLLYFNGSVILNLRGYVFRYEFPVRLAPRKLRTIVECVFWLVSFHFLFILRFYRKRVFFHSFSLNLCLTKWTRAVLYFLHTNWNITFILRFDYCDLYWMLLTLELPDAPLWRNSDILSWK